LTCWSSNVWDQVGGLENATVAVEMLDQLDKAA
jgi:hypothetical protein